MVDVTQLLMFGAPIGLVAILFLWLLLTGKFNAGISGLFNRLGDVARENLVKLTLWIVGIAIVGSIIIVFAILGLGYIFSMGGDSWTLWRNLGLPFAPSGPA